MGDIKEKAWAFPVVGGIIALIALLTPASYISEYYVSMYVWMWGLFSVQVYGYGGYTRFTADPGELTISLLCTIFILINIIAMVVIGALNKRQGTSEKNWVAPSVLVIVGTIIYIAGLEINTYLIGGFSYWQNVNPGFGVIGMFIGSIISLIGIGVLKSRTRPPLEVIVPMKKEIVNSVGESTPIGQSMKFCPECGHKILNSSHKFCVNCGFQIESFPSKIAIEPELEFRAEASEIEQQSELKALTIPPEAEEEGDIKQDCENCNLSRKLGRKECIWCGKTL
ncbi:MAG: hypothetical protein ACFE9Z_07015 [Promethearchaeota archaeon]